MQISEQTKKLIELALAEDIGAGDVTSNSVLSENSYAEFAFIPREEIIVCGLPIIAEIFQNLDFEAHYSDGEKISRGKILGIVRGNIREILRLERVTLNFLQHLSGIATLTNRYVQEIAHTKAQIFDTRKTTPAYRELEKYAVRCGGGQNHRMRLDDMVLIKDNHITAAGGIAAAVAAARNYIKSHAALESASRETPCQAQSVMTEVDNLTQLSQAIAAQPDIIMLDNFSLDNLRQAVQMVAGKIPLEASGGVNLQTVRAIAETGVERISTSKITQSAPAVDIGLDLI